MNDYDSMTARLRQSLENLGFEITEDGKHYKLTYFGDGRYTITISKTPSDARTGRNSAMQIIRDVF